MAEKNLSQIINLNDQRERVRRLIETVDGGGGPPHDGGMEDRIVKLEEFAGDARMELRSIDVRLSKIETRLDTFALSFATKADLHREINAQTWKLVTFVCGFGTALVAATYFMATHIK